MVRFGSGLSSGESAGEAAREAALQAARSLEGEAPKLAIVFASVSYPDAAEITAVLRGLFGDVPIVGGTAGACVYGPEHIAPRGVSIVLLGGSDLEVESRTVIASSAELLEVVPAAEDVARCADAAASRGLGHYVCLVFAPGVFVDGEALVAAVRKGAGARAQLAGGLTSDEFTMDRPKVFADEELRSDRIVVTGLFTRRPVGIAARHGGRPVGPIRTVTHVDGMFLTHLDDRPALDVWIEDARSAGADLPEDRKALALYLLDHYELGIADPVSRETSMDAPPELLARAPYAVREDGALMLSASMAEGTHVRVLHAETDDLLRAATEAARTAATRAGAPLAGALILSCAARQSALGVHHPREAALVREHVGAPVGGACVFGEIARNVRDSDAFYNMTAVIVAFPA